MYRTFLILTLAFLVACTSSDESQPYSFQVHEENGVTIAETKGGPKYEADLFSYEFVVELQEDERAESHLPRSGDFHMDERGWFYVHEYGDQRIAVFDSTGRYSHSIGRKGSGPGEFQETFHIVDLSDGIVTVSDPSQNRITRFTTNGDLIDVTTVTSPSVFFSHVYPLGENRFLAMGVEQTSYSQVIRMRPIALLHDTTGDTIASVPTHWIDFGHFDRTDNRTYPVLFQPRAAFTFQRGIGFLVTTGESPSLTVHNSSGQEIRRIDLGLEKVPTTAQDQARLREYHDAEIAVEGINERMREILVAQREHWTLSEYRAFWQGAQIDDGGFIWLEVPEHPLDLKNAENHSLWRVISPEGEYLGVTRRPPMSGLVMRGHLLTMDADMEAGILRLLVYRITPAVDGLKYP